MNLSDNATGVGTQSGRQRSRPSCAQAKHYGWGPGAISVGVYPASMSQRAAAFTHIQRARFPITERFRFQSGLGLSFGRSINTVDTAHKDRVNNAQNIFAMV